MVDTRTYDFIYALRAATLACCMPAVFYPFE